MTRSLRILFRADASLQIGTGHVMRCLTLADALRTQGAECRFICRAHPGNLIQHIEDKGFAVHPLPIAHQGLAPDEGRVPALCRDDDLAHAHWLGATQEADALDCVRVLQNWLPDWLVVDHYALDARWERLQRPHCDRLMVIDDLADRAHDCDLLLDQNLGRQPQDYAERVPSGCQILVGPKYALLRPEFAALRDDSLSRRAEPQLQQLLISMGGVDNDNATGRILDALKDCPLPTDCRIQVVMGGTAPWLDEVRRIAKQMPWETDVLVNVRNMAELMANSDLAIGAAGATSWERCCLGLPALMVVLAENQRPIADALDQAGAAKLFQVAESKNMLPQIIASLIAGTSKLRSMTSSGISTTDGRGTARFVDLLRGTDEDHSAL